MTDSEKLTLAWRESGLTNRKFALLCGLDMRKWNRMKAGTYPITPKVLGICQALLDAYQSPYANAR